MQEWDERSPGVVRFPSGRLVRGRSLRHDPRADLAPEPMPEPMPESVPMSMPELAPEFGLYLRGRPPPPVEWASRWVRWPDGWLPSDRADAREAVLELWRRAAVERVEVACAGGRGRTGTVLACLAVLDGVPADRAVADVRRRYHRRAVETPWQQRYVRRFEG